MSKYWTAVVLLALGGLVAACGQAATSPTPTPTSASAAIPTGSATVTPTATSPLSTLEDARSDERAEPEQASDQGVFVRVTAPLDEVRGYCLDIPGHLSGVRVESPLQVHTCKHGIWNQDGRFDLAALVNGVIRMPFYDLCLQAENTSAGGRLLLAACSDIQLQSWALTDSGEITLEASPTMCITVAAGPGRDAGGPQYLMKSVGIDVCEQQASERQRWTTVMPQ